jgi:hypothetical protein
MLVNEKSPQIGDPVVGLVIVNEPEAAHRVVSLAKDVAAFRRISMSFAPCRCSEGPDPI